jgi:hypothetical protein
MKKVLWFIASVVFCFSVGVLAACTFDQNHSLMQIIKKEFTDYYLLWSLGGLFIFIGVWRIFLEAKTNPASK